MLTNNGTGKRTDRADSMQKLPLPGMRVRTGGTGQVLFNLAADWVESGHTYEAQVALTILAHMVECNYASAEKIYRVEKKTQAASADLAALFSSASSQPASQPASNKGKGKGSKPEVTPGFSPLPEPQSRARAAIRQRAQAQNASQPASSQPEESSKDSSQQAS